MNARAEVFSSYAMAGTHAQDLVHCACHPVEISWADYLKAEHALLEEVLRAGVSSGEVDVANVELTSQAIICAYMVFTPPWVFRLRERVLWDRLDAMHDLVLEGLVRRRG